MREDFSIATRCAACHFLPGAATAVAVKAIVLNRVNDLLGKEVFLASWTSDNGANFKAAGQSLVDKDGFVPCFSHTLQLAIKGIIEHDIPF